MTRRQVILSLTAVWLVLVLVCLFSRSFVPIDETRYVSVAWNMWLRGDFLVPYLNGQAYSHKPPLLFWLFHAGWWAFGVNDWWPRLVPSFFALGSVLLTMRVLRLLWPEAHETSSSPVLLAPVILSGSLLWAVFSTATMFDMLVAFFTLLGMWGILQAWNGKQCMGWLVVGLAIGLGLLAKGPTILLNVLPAAALAPLWGRDGRRSWGRWYAGVLAAVAIGVMLALAWAIPAGDRGGPAYQQAIFWGQTADRMVHSFAHRHPLWWYLLLLPLILFPWTVWPPAWRALARLRHMLDDIGVRFCLTWFLSVFIAFSLISGKQMHYLLPIFPAFALLLAHSLDTGAKPRRIDSLWPGLMLVAFGLALWTLPRVAPHHTISRWMADASPIDGLELAVIGMLVAAIKCTDMRREIWKMMVFCVAAVMTFTVLVVKGAGPAYDMRPIGARIKTLQDTGVPLAHAGKYFGQYQFLGRLAQTPEIVDEEKLTAWFAAHPEGRAIVYFNYHHPYVSKLRPDYIQAYRGDHVMILDRKEWLGYAPQSGRDGSRGGGGGGSGAED